MNLDRMWTMVHADTAEFELAHRIRIHTAEAVRVVADRLVTCEAALIEADTHVARLIEELMPLRQQLACAEQRATNIEDERRIELKERRTFERRATSKALADPMATMPGVVVDIASILELGTSSVIALVQGEQVAGVHPTIAERARLMWADAIERAA
jgi:hypothetical protein